MDISYSDKTDYIKMYGQINEGDAEKLSSLLPRRKDKENLRIELSSRGGSVNEAYAICKIFLKQYTLGVAVKNIDSAATLLFLCCSQRHAMENCTFFFHMPTFRKKDNEKQKIDNILKVSCLLGDLEPAQLLAMMEKETTLSAKEAMEIGIVHYLEKS